MNADSAMLQLNDLGKWKDFEAVRTPEEIRDAAALVDTRSNFYRIKPEPVNEPGGTYPLFLMHKRLTFFRSKIAARSQSALYESVDRSTLVRLPDGSITDVHLTAPEKPKAAPDSRPKSSRVERDDVKGKSKELRTEILRLRAELKRLLAEYKAVRPKRVKK